MFNRTCVVMRTAALEGEFVSATAWCQRRFNNSSASSLSRYGFEVPQDIVSDSASPVLALFLLTTSVSPTEHRIFEA